jgi:hypothetical protein
VRAFGSHTGFPTATAALRGQDVPSSPTYWSSISYECDVCRSLTCSHLLRYWHLVKILNRKVADLGMSSWPTSQIVEYPK